MNITELLTVIAILAFLFVIVFWSLPFFYDYRFNEDGIDIVCIGGIFRVWRIEKEQIKNVRILKFQHIFTGNELWIMMSGQSLINRIQSKFLVVEKTGLVPYLYITPSNPEKAMSQLNITIRHISSMRHK